MMIGDFINAVKDGKPIECRVDFRYNGVVHKAGTIFDNKKYCLSIQDLMRLFNAHRIGIKKSVSPGKTVEILNAKAEVIWPVETVEPVEAPKKKKWNFKKES